MWSYQDILAQHEPMKIGRAYIDPLRQECAQLLLPRQSNFSFGGQYPNIEGETRIFDEYAQQALEQGVSIFEGFVIPRGQIWQRWELADDDLMKKQHVRAWVEEENQALFRLRNDPKSGFTGQVHESVASLYCFGMQSMWVDIRRDRSGKPIGLSYQSEFINEIYVREDHQGLIDTTHRSFWMKAHQVESKWPGNVPACVKKALDGNDPTKAFEFIHRIAPNPGYDPDRIDAMGKPWGGAYICVGEPDWKVEGGYHSVPRIVSRLINAPNEDYGRCWAFTILPAIRATQQMMVDLMAAIEMKAMPPLGAHSDMQDQIIRYASREVTYGAFDSRGNRRIGPLVDGADMTDAMNLLEKLHGHIDRAFFVDMLQIRRELKSHVTDSQLYQREEEKGMLLAPLANQETEWFTVMLDRELACMEDMGMMDDMPGEIAEAMDAGVGLRVAYDNGLSRAQEAGAAAGYFRMLEQFAPVFQADPPSWQIFTQKYPLDKVLDHMGRINGVPTAWEATDEERAAKAEGDAQANASQQLIEALPNIGKAANDLGSMVPTSAVA